MTDNTLEIPDTSLEVGSATVSVVCLLEPLAASVLARPELISDGANEAPGTIARLAGIHAVASIRN